MGNHDEFDLDVRFANSGSMWASDQPQGEQGQAYTGRDTCRGNTDCGTCQDDTIGCAGCQTQTCNTHCNQNTCANTCGNQNTCVQTQCNQNTCANTCGNQNTCPPTRCGATCQRTACVGC